MSVTQTDFRAALLDPGLIPPDGLIDPTGAPAGRRFNIYRNNVAHSLTEALKTGFPAILKLLGDQNFTNLAQLYLRQSPPQSPLMMHYGEDFPEFLSGFEPLAHLPYLADTARLELAMRASYHAADATPDPDALSRIPPEALDNARLTLAPSLQVVASPWPIVTIWAYNMADGPAPQAGGECALILRPDFDPEPQPAPLGSDRFIDAIRSGLTLATAMEHALHTTPDFDLGTLLGLLISGQAILNATSHEMEITSC